MTVPSYLPQQAAIHAYYALEDTVDGVAGAHNLTNEGTATFVAGKFANCVKIESAKYLKLNATPLPQRKGSYSCWVKLYTEVTSGLYYIWYDINGLGSYCIKAIWYEYNSGTPRLAFWLYTYAMSEHYVYYNITLGTDNWYQIGYTINGDSGTLTGYVNGVSVGTSGTSLSGAADPGNNFGIGSTYAGASYLLGYVDEFVIWDNIVLTDAEMLKVYRGPMSKGFSGGQPWIF